MSDSIKTLRSGSKEPDNLLFDFMTAHQWILLSCENLMTDLGHNNLNREDYMTIAALGCGQKTIFQLADILCVDVKIAHERARRLETAGFVEILRALDEGLQKQIVFTVKGWHLIRDLSTVLSKIEVQLKDRIGATAVTQIRDALSSYWGEALCISDLKNSEDLE